MLRINPVFMCIILSLWVIDISKREYYYIILNEDILYIFSSSQPISHILVSIYSTFIYKTKSLGKYVYIFYKILRKIHVLLKHRNIINNHKIH